MRSTRLVLAAGGCAAAFLALTLYVRFIGPVPGDTWLLARARAWRPSRPEADLLQFFGSLATPAVAAACMAAVSAVTARRLGARKAVIVVVACGAALLEPPLSKLVGRTDAALEAGIFAGGYPSGHAVIATGLCGVVGALAVKGEVRAIAALLWVGVLVNRVISGSHLLDEVLGGALLGGAWLCLVLAVARH